MRGWIASLVAAAALTAPAIAHGDVVWLCKPGLGDNPCDVSMDTTIEHADGSSDVESHGVPADPPVDCFYVYPTTSNQLTVNANKARDPELKAIAKFQAARFGMHCKVYAPIYRQLTLLGLETASAQQKAAAFKTAYADVREAWHDYLAHYNFGRGFVLIGHSQGSRMLRQLIHDEVDKVAAERRRLISVFIPGGNVLVKKGSDRGGDFQHVGACRSVRQLRCVMAFSTFNYGPPDDTRFGRSPTADPGNGMPFGPSYEVLCTNPASLRNNTRLPLHTVFPSSLFPPVIGLLLIQMFGGLQPTAPTPWVTPADSYTGRCETHNGANVLFIAPIGSARRLNPSPDSTWGQHLADGNIALDDVVRVVGQQVRRYLALKRRA